jgi:hypothetical protein
VFSDCDQTTIFVAYFSMISRATRSHVATSASVAVRCADDAPGMASVEQLNVVGDVAERIEVGRTHVQL